MSRRTEVTLIHDPIVISSGRLPSYAAGVAVAVGIAAIIAGGYFAYRKYN